MADTVFQPNPWETLLGGAGPDGQVSLELALKSFVLAIGPLPGVPAPQPPLPTADEIGPGEVAIYWVHEHWDELTPAQQAAVDAYVAPGPDAVIIEPLSADATAPEALVPGRAVAALTQETPLEHYQAILRDAEIVIINRLGRTRTRNYSLTVNDTQQVADNALAYAYPSFGTCAIHINPLLLQEGRAPAETSATLAHELFHCFQFELGDTAGRAAWVVEGEAEWVGESAGGPSQTGAGWWQNYLATPARALFARTYDGVGFYQHMAERGIDTWKLLDKIFLARGGPDAYHAGADPGGDGFLYSWSSGYFKSPALGGEWDAQGPWAVGHVAPESLVVANGDSVPFNVEPYKVRIARVAASADILNINMSGITRIRDDSGYSQDGLPDVSFCVEKLGGSCACPPGSTYVGPVLAPLGFASYLSITGATGGVVGTLTGLSLDDFCNPDETPPPTLPGGGNPGTTPPCPRGCAGSNGEPHLRTVDKVGYDLQAAGEYVLLRSPDGAIEIQSRQEPRGVGANFTINTAVATRVNGHRVAVYTGTAGLQVRVDGQLTDLATAQDLGAGARAVRYASGIEIDLPDGSRMYAVAMRSSCCLNIVIAPSDGLRTNGVGLLGNVSADGLPVPAMPDGTRLPRAENAHDRFVSIYDTLAPAWLVSDATTLFDYDTGKTTQSYLVEGFPAEAQTKTIADLTPQQRATAQTSCAAVTDADLLLECMFDVTFSDLENWAQLYGLTGQFIAGGTDVLDQAQPDPDALPEGFVELMPDLVGIRGAAIGPDGLAYLSVQETFSDYAVLAVDLASGTIVNRLAAAGGGRVALAGGSVWVGDLEGGFSCSISSLDPATLAVRGSVAVPCDIAGSTFASFDDAIWFLDRTTADMDAHGGRLRRIDPQTQAVSGDIIVPFVNGYLTSTPDALFWQATGSLSQRPEDASLYRLLPGETAMTSFGPRGSNSGPLDRLFPAGQGFWSSLQPDSPPLFHSTPGDAGVPLALDGLLAGADESALYAQRISTFDSLPELWRYPIDGSAPTRVAVGVKLQTANGDQMLSYIDNDPLLFDQEYALKLWLVRGRVDVSKTSLVMAATPLP